MFTGHSPVRSEVLVDLRGLYTGTGDICPNIVHRSFPFSMIFLGTANLQNYNIPDVSSIIIDFSCNLLHLEFFRLLRINISRFVQFKCD